MPEFSLLDEDRRPLYFKCRPLELLAALPDGKIGRKLVEGRFERKSWSSCPKCDLSNQIVQTKLWIKQLNILETGSERSFLNVVFISLWACNGSFPSFWCIPTGTRIEMQRRVVTVWTLESWEGDPLYVYTLSPIDFNCLTYILGSASQRYTPSVVDKKPRLYHPEKLYGGF